MKSKRTKPAKRTKARSSRAAARVSTKSRAVDNLQERVNELEETLRAIRSGEVDAVVVSAPAGDQVFTLQGAEHPYRLLVETIDEGAATLSNDGTILYSNRSFANIFDAQLERFIGTPIENFVSGEYVEALRALIRNAADGVARGEIRLVDRGGRARTVRLTLTRSSQFGMEALCAVATELTELVETNEALRVTESSLRQLSGRLLQLQDEERRRIARDLHDTTGQKIAALSMSLDRVARLLDSKKPERQEALDEGRDIVRTIGEEIRTLSYLLHPPLLDESGLGSAVRWYAEGFQKRSGIRLNVNISPDLGRLSTDVEMALFRVVQESLTNVHRYSGSPDAEINVVNTPDAVKLEIIDHGKGIAVGSARVKAEGIATLGVGIPGMRERIRQFGGQLEVDFGRDGTRVSASVPLKKAKVVPAIEESEVVVASTNGNSSGDAVSSSDTRRRILIADDHEVMRRGVRGLLESHDEWAVCGEAFEGREVVTKSRELRPDLIIMDINMPGLTGIDAAQQIRRENPSAKILFFSVHESAQTVREVVNAGAQGYVAKSRAGHDLVDAVRNVLDGGTFFPSFARSA
ncbi:MAG TPA: response regulator [Candidatus Eremiobacteraceae bacterium]|jgi:two-component system NarL family sensor kinase|nr:response regulator [Candidatus Eremiobacteraceae bacterium]